MFKMGETFSRRILLEVLVGVAVGAPIVILVHWGVELNNMSKSSSQGTKLSLSVGPCVP